MMNTMSAASWTAAYVPDALFCMKIVASACVLACAIHGCAHESSCTVCLETVSAEMGTPSCWFWCSPGGSLLLLQFWCAACRGVQFGTGLRSHAPHGLMPHTTCCMPLARYADVKQDTAGDDDDILPDDLSALFETPTKKVADSKEKGEGSGDGDVSAGTNGDANGTDATADADEDGQDDVWQF